MKAIVSAVLLSLVVVSCAFPGRHSHMGHHGPMRIYDECARSAGLSNETMTKMREHFKSTMKDFDPKKLKDKLDPSKQAEEMKGVVKEAEADKAEAFESCLNTIEERMINRSPMIACANTTELSSEAVTKVRQAIQNSKTETDMKKRHKQLSEDVKKAVEETDKDKSEAYYKCVNDTVAKFNLMKGRHHHKGHGGGGAKSGEKAETKPDDDAKPADD